jgi:hypothetical protein
MESSELWPDALPLDEAWFILGSEEQKIQYRNAGHNQHLTVYLKTTMRRVLLDRIHDGELLCLGVRIAPDLGGIPEFLPQFLFDTPDVDWEKSTLRAFGRVYEGLRVIPRQQVSEIDLPRPATAKRQGRPPVGDKIREIVRDLGTKGRLDGLSRKEQENLVRSRARERYPRDFPKESQPSRGKILEALKAEEF